MAEQRGNERLPGRKTAYAGAGLALGAGAGSIFGLLALTNLPLGAGIGAAIGLLIGAGIDASNARRSGEEEPGRAVEDSRPQDQA